MKARTPFLIFPFNKDQYEVLLFASSLDFELVNQNIENMQMYSYPKKEYVCSLKKDYKVGKSYDNR